MARNWAYHSRWTDYGIALGVMVAALLVRWGLDPWLGERAPSLTLLLAIAAVATWGGWRPGLLVTLVGGVFANVIFVEPRGAFNVASTTPLIQFLLFNGVGIGICIIAEFRLRSQARATREAQRAAREARRNQNILNSISDGFVALDAQWRFSYVNKAAERMLQRTEQDLLGKVCWDVFPQLRDSEIQRRLEAVAHAGVSEQFETPSILDDGWIHATAYPCDRVLFDAQCITILFHDITDRKRAEELATEHQRRLEEEVKQQTQQLEQAQQVLRRTERLASLGTLSSGMTHDIGNLILPIRFRLQALRRLEVPEEAEAHLQTIEDATSRLSELTSILRLFSLNPLEPPKPEDAVTLGDWCRKTQRLHRMVLPKNVTLKCSVPEDLPPVAMHIACLTQAVYNLVLNAGEAIDGSNDGEVLLSAYRSEQQKVEIAVEDNGRGMSKDEIAHCMEPFFTTKTRSISTGLGLPLVHGILKSAGGTMEVESPPPGKTQGTKVTLTVPEAVEVPLDAEGRIAAVMVGDARVASMFRMILELSGWAVQGHDIESGEATDVDLLVLDAADEGLGLAQRFKEQSPDGAVICVGEADQPWRKLGAVALSGRPTPNSVRQALRAVPSHVANG